MESMSPTHSVSPPTSREQEPINRATSIVELPQPADRVDPHDGDRGASGSTDHGAAGATPAPAISASTTATVPPAATALLASSPIQQYSPTQAEIDTHPIRQRLSVHGDSVAVSGWGLSDEGQPRQEQAIGGVSRDTGAMTEVKEGDEVAWNWGSGAPGGTAAEVVTDGEAKMVSHRGNEVKKQGSPDNPAVHIERPGNDVVKKASELEVEEKGPKHADGQGEEKKEDDKAEKKDDEKKDDEEKKGGEEKKDEDKTNGESKTGEKRSADEATKDDEPKANGEEQQPPKKKGRPAKNGGAAKKETKKKQPKPAATADGKPRRSGRNRG